MPLSKISDALFSADPGRRRSYRALLAWTVCTLLLMTGALDTEHYAWVTMAFIGGEALGKFAGAKGGQAASANVPAADEPSEERSTSS